MDVVTLGAAKADAKRKYVATDAMVTTNGRRAVCVGDSVMAAGSVLPYLSDPASWFTMMCYLSGGKLIQLRNAGHPGTTSDYQLANFDSDTAGADVVFIMPSTNDIGSVPVAWATSKANMVEMIRRCRLRGQEPIICLMTPRTEDAQLRATQTRKRNIQWAKYAQDNRIRLVDPYSPILDPATGAPKAIYSGDGLHPNQAGAYAMASSVLAQLDGFLKQGSGRIMLPQTNTLGPNLLTGGIFSTDNGAGKANGWNMFGGSSTGSFTTDAAIPGRIWHVDFTGSVEISQSVPVGGGTPVINVGDTLQLVGKIKQTATSGNVQAQYGAKQTGLSGKDHLPCRLLTNFTSPDWFTFSIQFVVEAGCTGVLTSINQVVSSQTGSFDLAQFGLYNLTTQPV